MTVDAIERRRGRPAAAPRVRLSCDDSGSWTLSGQNNPARRFPDFETALGIARHAPVSQAATIEVWQSGEYICCLPPQEGLHHKAATDAAPIASKGRVFTAAERSPSRTAQFLMATAGLLFWLALMVLALAASLGWRLFLL
ncbi:MAG TPA: hypothetical protein VN900_10565 [Stellaceae bacterium]|jgi:hypothetical protein|nr:hypothetical protein [Stellaceae bacterium]